MKRLSWIFGLLCGIFFAWAFAPEKGKELRKKMANDREEGKLGLAPLTRDVSAAFKDAAHEVSKHFKDEIELVRELYRQNSPEVSEKAVTFDTHKIAKRAQGARGTSSTLSAVVSPNELKAKRKAAPRKVRTKSKKSDSK